MLWRNTGFALQNEYPSNCCSLAGPASPKQELRNVGVLSHISLMLRTVSFLSLSASRKQHRTHGSGQFNGPQRNFNSSRGNSFLDTVFMGQCADTSRRWWAMKKFSLGGSLGLLTSDTEKVIGYKKAKKNVWRWCYMSFFSCAFNAFSCINEPC